MLLFFYIAVGKNGSADGSVMVALETVILLQPKLNKLFQYRAKNTMRERQSASGICNNNEVTLRGERDLCIYSNNVFCSPEKRWVWWQVV